MKHLTIASLFLLALAATAMAQPPMGSRGGADLESMGGRHGGAHLEFLADVAGLSDEQRDKVSELVDASKLAGAVDRERMRQIRDALFDLSAADTGFDTGEAQVLADELGQIVARTAAANAELHWQIRQVLTDEQRAAMDEMKRHHSMSRGRFGPRRSGGGEPPETEE
jgi:Spy/CpxP family protein refolding chaperone